jgi:secreted trypsin-like serine protease
MMTGLLGDGAIDINSSNRNSEGEPDGIDIQEIYSADLVKALNSDDNYDNDFTIEQIAETASVTRNKVQKSGSLIFMRKKVHIFGTSTDTMVRLPGRALGVP